MINTLFDLTPPVIDAVSQAGGLSLILAWVATTLGYRWAERLAQATCKKHHKHRGRSTCQ